MPHDIQQFSVVYTLKTFKNTYTHTCMFTHIPRQNNDDKENKTLKEESGISHPYQRLRQVSVCIYVFIHSWKYIMECKRLCYVAHIYWCWSILVRINIRLVRLQHLYLGVEECFSWIFISKVGCFRYYFPLNADLQIDLNFIYYCWAYCQPDI